MGALLWWAADVTGLAISDRVPTLAWAVAICIPPVIGCLALGSRPWLFVLMASVVIGIVAQAAPPVSAARLALAGLDAVALALIIWVIRDDAVR